VFFAAMILATLFYSGFFIAIFDADPATVPTLSRPLSVMLVLHLLAQAVFTVQIHRHRLTALVEAAAPLSRWAVPTLWTTVVGALALGYFWRLLPALAPAPMTTGEAIYRVFMSFYGLVFPAYVWICMIPTADGHAGLAGPRGRFKLIVLLGAVALAAPCYWLGFIAREWVWLAPGLGVVLLGRLAVRRGPS
jgi:hypothetical protein